MLIVDRYAPTIRVRRAGVTLACLCVLASLAVVLPLAVSAVSRVATTPGSPVAAALLDERRDLERDEQLGGHTLERHIGRTDEQLAERLRREPQISAASTYTDRPIAERTVARALARNRSRVDRWLGRRGPRPNLALNYHDNDPEPVGRSMMRRARRTVPCWDVLVVLRWDRGSYYVLTSYPEAPRR